MATRACNFELSGRRALVCGASKGIGRATALALAELGADVTVLARSEARLAALRDELLAAGAGRADYLVADLDDRDGLVATVRAYLESGAAPTILVNNSGGPPAGPILEATIADFETALGRHLYAAHLLVGLLLPGMVEAGYGRIINIISTSVREPIPNLGVSNTTRGAMASWAKTLSAELPPNVTINNLLPGFTDTERLGELAGVISEGSGASTDEVYAGWISTIPEGRLGRPEELGATIAFLATPAAAYIRGMSIAVDGGRTRSI